LRLRFPDIGPPRFFRVVQYRMLNSAGDRDTFTGHEGHQVRTKLPPFKVTISEGFPYSGHDGHSGAGDWHPTF